MKNYSSDKAVSTHIQDEFQRYPFAKRIAQTILESTSENGLVIGLYGAWGEGKTSVLDFISTEIENGQKKNLVVLKFNPWRFGDEGTLLKMFFQELAAVLGEQLYSRSQKIGKRISKNENSVDETGGMLSAIIDYGDLVASAVKPFVPIVGAATKVAKNVIKSLADVPLEKLKEKIEKYLVAHKKRVVVILDDLDRLEANEIHAIFRLVKLTANFKYTTYLLAFDDTLVAEVLSSRYDGNKKRGYDYLEKIIQVPLRLPAVMQADIFTFCISRVKEVFQAYEIRLTPTDLERLETCLRSAIAPAITTPRMVLRFTNACTFAVPLMKGIANVTDVVLMEAMKLFFPKLYDFIGKNGPDIVSRDGRVFVNTSGKAFGENLKRHVEECGASAALLILNMFPESLKYLDKPLFFQEPDASQIHLEMRVCSSDYFDRYYTYSVLKGDLPDNVLDEAISGFNENVAANISSLENLFDRFGAETVLYKLEQKQSSYDSNVSIFLAPALSQLATHFKRTLDFGWHTLSGRLANLVVKLASRAEKKDDLYLHLALKSNPLNFGFEVRDSLLHSEKEWEVKHRALLEKINRGLLSAYDRIVPKYHVAGDFPFDQRLLLLFRHQYTGDFKEYIKTMLDKRPESSLTLIQSFTGFVINSTPGADVLFTNFTKETYAVFAKYFDVDLISKAIIKFWGAKFKNPKYKHIEQFYETQTNENLLKQFMALHNEISKTTP